MLLAPSCTSAASSRLSNRSFSPRVVPGFHCVGWVKDAHGLRGEIYVKLSSKKADWLKKVKTFGLCLPVGGEFVEYKIKAARPHKEGLIVHLEGLSDRNQSEALRKQSVYIGEKLLASEPGEAIFLNQILGFSVVNESGVVLGEITGFGTNGPQDLLKVKGAHGESLIPLIDAFLRHIDFDLRTVTMELPPGLFDL